MIAVLNMLMKHLNQLRILNFIMLKIFILKDFQNRKMIFFLLTIKNTLFGVLPKYFIEIVAIRSIFL